LIQKDEIGLMNECLRESDALKHALGEAAQPPVAVRRESHQLDHGGNAFAKFRGRHAAEPAMQLQELRSGEPVVESKVFGKKSDAAADLHISHRRPQYVGVAAGRL